MLQHTVGDLSISTCLFTLITWVPTKHGELCMVTIDETPGNLTIKNTPTTSDYIRQVEPNHTERIFGVRMAATAQMKTKDAY